MNERKYKIDWDLRKIVNKRTGKPIPDDEPLFIFRAQDRQSLPPIVAYMILLPDLEQRADVQKSIEAFRRWQEEHPDKVKEPD